MRRCWVLMAMLAWLSAADVAEQLARVRATVPEDLIGTGAYVAALQRAYQADSWDAEAQVAWQLAIARAQLHAELVDEAAATLGRLTPLITPATRPEWQRLRIEQWRLQAGRDPRTVAPESIVEALRQEPVAAAELVAAYLAEAQRAELLADHQAALAAYDQALALLQDAQAERREPVYGRRLLAMEASGMRVDAIQEWFQKRSDDPATSTLLASIGTRAHEVVGKGFPALELPLLMAPDATWTLAKEGGHPVLLYIYAHWAPSCRVVDQLVVELAADWPGLRVVCWSLHYAGQEEAALQYAERQELPGTLVGDGQGWDDPRLRAFGIEAVPHLMLIDGDGVIRANDLVAEDPAATWQRLQAAKASLNDNEVAVP